MDAAQEINQVMMAAAKSQRDGSTGQVHHAHHKQHPVQPPKVIPGPQIMGKGSTPKDISHFTAYINNLKLQNAVAAA